MKRFHLPYSLLLLVSLISFCLSFFVPLIGGAMDAQVFWVCSGWWTFIMVLMYEEVPRFCRMMYSRIYKCNLECLNGGGCVIPDKYAPCVTGKI
jgi:hypothetical protein